MCAQGMLVLFFDDDRNAGANVAGSGFSGEQEAGGVRHLNIDRTRHGFQIPTSGYCWDSR